MIKTKVKSLIAKFLLANMVFTMMPISAFAEVNNPEIANTMVKVGMPTISPTPQDAQTIGDGFVVTNSVNIIGGDVADQDAKRELLAALNKLGIEVNEAFVDSDTTIIIGEQEDEIEAMDKVLESANMQSVENNEGYVLVSKKGEDGKSAIAIEGKDGVGTFYGVMTLKQLLIDGETIQTPEISIKDYPTQHVRAVVEGFYGNPWTHQDRLDQFKFYGENKMNMYIYAPKDDPYHRDKWREPYPAEEMERMQELINVAHENKVDFVFAISPGKDIDVNSEEDYQALISKCESLYAMGVRSFSILWDDIFTDDGAGQAKVMNRFNEEFVKAKGDVKPLITVPTQYWGDSMFSGGEVKPYTQQFASNLDEDIEVMWTGEWVVSDDVTLEHAEKINNIYNRKMLLWWNYPVNDYNPNKMALGPIYNLSNQLHTKIGGFIINPMEFAEASKISTHTGADYAWNTEAYNPEVAWNNAIEKVVGESLKESFRIVADHSTRVDVGRHDAPEMKALMDTFWEKVDNNQIPTEEVESLKSGFVKVKAAAEDVLANLNSAMLEEIRPQVEKLSKYADAATTAADMVIAMMNGDSNTWWNLKSVLSIQIEDIDASTAKISESVLDNFIRVANTKTDEMYFNSIIKDEVKTYSYSASVSENLSPLKYQEWYNSKAPYELANMFDGKYDTAYRSSGTIKAGNEIVVDLGQVEKLDNIYMLMGRTSEDNMVMHGNLEISVDGANWKTVVSNNTFREVFASDLNEEARYVRYTATADQENQVFVREFQVNKNTNSLVNKTVDTDIKYVKELVNRSEVNSAVATDKINFKAGDSVGVELVDFRFISEVKVNSEAKGKVEYTINGMDWFELGTNNSGDTIVLDKPQVVKQVRFVATEDKKSKDFRLDVVLESREQQTVETDRKGSGNYKDLSAIVDGDLDSSFISSGQLLEGNYFKVDLGKVTNVRNFQYIGDRAYGGDRIRDGKIEYSLDGENWTEFYNGVISEQFRMFDLDFEARYLRITANKHTDAWVRTSDISVNDPVAEVIFQSTVKPMDDNHRLNNLMDSNIQTSYIPKEDVKAGDNIVYNIFDGAIIKNVEIFQNEQTISNAKVVARTADNELIELGRLDKGYNSFTIEKASDIRSITIEFEDGMGRPEIYEIVTENYSLEAIKELANNNIAKAKELLANTEGKSQEAIDSLKTALEKVEKMLADGASKEDIFRANKELEAAIKAYVEDEVTKPEVPNNGNNNGNNNNNNSNGNNNNSGNNSNNNGSNNGKPNNLPNTGAPINPISFAGIGLAITGIGAAIFKRKKK